jgi:hypothetical protein
MSDMPMAPDEEYEFYAQPENQEPQGPARRRGPSQPCWHQAEEGGLAGSVGMVSVAG